MSEKNPSKPTPDYYQEERKRRYDCVLRLLGVEIPPIPDPTRTEPRPFLIRGDANCDRLLQGKMFQPQTGRLGKFGVFLADCWGPVMTPIMYVFPREIAPAWLVEDSPEYTKLAESVSQEYSLNRTKIGEGSTVDEIIHQRHCIYTPKSGICTLCNSLSIDCAKLILVPTEQYDETDLKSLREKYGKRIEFVRPE